MSTDLNIFACTGRLTNDAELKQFSSGKSFLKFSVACNTGFGEYAKANFFNCIMVGDKRAQALAPYLVKGKSVAVSGRIEKNDWTDKDGLLRKEFQVQVQELTLLSDGKNSTTDNSGQQTFGYKLVDEDEESLDGRLAKEAKEVHNGTREPNTY